MKVRNLINSLQGLPQDADVWIIYDGEARIEADVVFVARSGNVMLTDTNQPVYSSESRPVSAPTEEQNLYWKTLPLDSQPVQA